MTHTEEMRLLEKKTLQLLRRYMSDPAARGVVRRARLRSSDHDPETGFLEAVLFGANLFVQDRVRPRVAQEIRQLGGDDERSASVGERHTFPIFDEHDARKARMRARQMAEDAGASKLDALKAATGLSELARNILMYAREGEITIEIVDHPRRIRVVATDHGPGIRDVELVLSGNYRSKSGLGRGLVGTRRLADGFRVDTGEAGTTVTFEMRL